MRTKATTSGGVRRTAPRLCPPLGVTAGILRGGVSTAISGVPDLLSVALPVGENGTDRLGLGHELGERGVGGGLEGVAGVAVEELGDLGGRVDVLTAFLHQRGPGVLRVRIAGQDGPGGALDVDLLRLGGGEVAHQVVDLLAAAGAGAGEVAVHGGLFGERDL